MRSLKTLAAVAASAALVISSTATAAVPAIPQQVTAPNAWLALASLSSSGPAAGPAIATCGAAAAAAAAAQPSGGCVLPVGTVVPAAVPPPPPPPPPEAFGPHFSGELLGILIWLPLIAIALGTSGPNVRPNSPA